MGFWSYLCLRVGYGIGCSCFWLNSFAFVIYCFVADAAYLYTTFYIISSTQISSNPPFYYIITHYHHLTHPISNPQNYQKTTLHQTYNKYLHYYYYYSCYYCYCYSLIPYMILWRVSQNGMSSIMMLYLECLSRVIINWIVSWSLLTSTSLFWLLLVSYCYCRFDEISYFYNYLLFVIKRKVNLCYFILCCIIVFY